MGRIHTTTMKARKRRKSTINHLTSDSEGLKGTLRGKSSASAMGRLAREVNCPLDVHCHNDFGLAVANTIAAVEAGASQVQVTVNGLGERAGNADLAQTVMIMLSAARRAARSSASTTRTSVSPSSRQCVLDRGFTSSASSGRSEQ